MLTRLETTEEDLIQAKRQTSNYQQHLRESSAEEVSDVDANEFPPEDGIRPLISVSKIENTSEEYGFLRDGIASKENEIDPSLSGSPAPQPISSSTSSVEKNKLSSDDETKLPFHRGVYSNKGSNGVAYMDRVRELNNEVDELQQELGRMREREYLTEQHTARLSSTVRCSELILDPRAGPFVFVDEPVNYLNLSTGRK